MEKGQTNNPNGRPKGSQNKFTATLRNWLLELINGQREQLLTDLQKLEPKERLEFITKVLPYLLPKVVNAVEVENAAFTKADVKETAPLETDWFKKEKVVQNWYEQENE